MINLISQRNAKTFHGSICETSISYIRLKDFMYKQLSVAADTADTDSATEVFLAPRKSFDILALYKSDYYYY